MRSIKKHYHWVIAAVVLVQIIAYGGVLNNLPIFTIPVTEGLGISRSTYSLAYSMMGFAAILGTFFSGSLLLHFGYRKPVLSCLIIASIAFATLASSENAVTLGIGFMLLGLTNGICVSAGPARIISIWFQKHQGTVLGCVNSATGLGGSLMCILLTAVITGSGWSGAYWVGAILLAVTAVIMLLIVRDRPQDMGLKPYGQGEGLKKKKHRRADEHWIGYTEAQLKRTPVFYMMIVCTFFSDMFAVIALGVFVPHLQDSGLSVQDAATMQSTLMLVLAALKIGLGVMSDAVGAKRTFVMCMVGGVASQLMLLGVKDTGSALVATLLYTFPLPLTSLMIPLLTSALFGYQAQAKCLGIVLAAASVGGTIAPIIANSVYDMMGSYHPVFWGAAIGMAVMIPVYLWMFRLADRDKKKILAELEKEE